MIGLFGSQTANCRGTSKFTTSTNAFKMKSKATNMLLDNQLNEKLKEVNNNLIKKRPHFLKFFNDSFLKSSSGSSSSDYSSSYKRWISLEGLCTYIWVCLCISLLDEDVTNFNLAKKKEKFTRGFQDWAGFMEMNKISHIISLSTAAQLSALLYHSWVDEKMWEIFSITVIKITESLRMELAWKWGSSSFQLYTIRSCARC